MARRVDVDVLAENGIGKAPHGLHEPFEPVNLPVVRKWFVQVQVVHSGRLQGHPYVFPTQELASEAIAQLEREHRAMGWQDRYEVVCWVE